MGSKEVSKHTQEKLKQWGRSRSLSEIDLLHVQDFLLEMATLEVKEMERQRAKLRYVVNIFILQELVYLFPISKKISNPKPHENSRNI